MEPPLRRGPPVETRALGASGRAVSRLGFGCGGYWGLPALPEREATALVHAALERGIRWFDTGPTYSMGNAEPRLGRVLRGLRREDLLVSTKIGTRAGFAGRAVKDFRPETIRRSVRASLARLGLDSLPLVFAHSPTLADLEGGMLDVLRELRAAGLVQLLGFAGGGRAAARAIELGAFDCVMVTYNLLHRESAALIESAVARRVGVVAKSPLAHGLCGRDWRVRRPSDAWYALRTLVNHRRDIGRAARFRFVAEVPGWRPGEVALAYVLGNPAVDCAIVGTVDERHLEENVAASHRQLPPELRRRIEAV